MDWDLVSKLGSLGFSIAAFLYALFATRRKDVDERFKAGSDRMDRLDARIARQEQTVGNMPGREDLHRVELEITKIAGVMGRMEAVMEGNSQIMGRLEQIVTRHENHLLNGSSR